MTDKIRALPTPIPKANRNAAGEIILKAGQRYYIDVPSDEQFLKAYEYLRKLPLEKGSALKSGRGPVLVSFTPKKDTIIPRYVAALTGHWFLNEGNQPLNEIQRKLYGDVYDTPQDAWEYLADKFPGAFDFTASAAEGVASVKDELQDALKMMGGAVIAAVFVGILVYAVKSSNRLPAREDEEELEIVEME